MLLISAASLGGGFLLSYLVFTDAGTSMAEDVKVAYVAVEDFTAKALRSVQGTFSFTGTAGTTAEADDSIKPKDSDAPISVPNKDARSFVDIQKYDLAGKEKAVLANLEDMTLSFYESGKKTMEVPILSKGRPGSPWETPSGEYEVLYKEETHFSSIGKVYMPSSIQFFGNFFIHGWPYYPDGTPVAEGYSGGCIRLSSEDAAKVFEFVERGTPIFVYGSNTEADASVVRNQGRYLIEDNAGLALSADSFLVADLDTGEVIMEKARGQVRPIASVSKLMTSLVSLEVVNQYQNTTLSSEVIATEGYSGGLAVGETITTGELLYPLLLESSNDAAEALARHYGRKYFIEQMNNKAKSIGLKATRFEDPSGLSPLNVSSAEDLFLLTQHIYRNKKHIFDVSLLENYRVENHLWGNISKFLGYESYLGGKNGYTDEAGKTVVALFSLPLAEFEEREIAIVLLSTNDIKRDVDRILGFLERHVSYASSVPIADAGTR